MEEKHKELIRSNGTCLANYIRDHIEKVCDFIYEKKIITISMKEKLMSYETAGRQSSELLILLRERGARAFPALYEACKKCGLKNAADILRPDKDHKISETGSVITAEQMPLPDKWPTKEHLDQVKNGKLEVKKVIESSNPKMFEKFELHLNKNIYPMYHHCRGNALIINIETFADPDLESRKGCQFDVQGLKQLFTGLGFHVKNEQKKWNKDEIDKAIMEETGADHSKHDCFVFFIMTHGRQGGVLDANGTYISMKSIIDKFIEVDDLKSKPKLFFFQACQAGAKGNRDSKKSAGSTPADTEDVSNDMEDDLNLLPDSVDDVIVFKSSPAGAKSIREVDSGSWFIQAIIYVFSEFAHRCEISELFSKVNDLVSKAEPLLGEKNVGEFHITPKNLFFFFPGLSHD